jgi:hypothetical protein
LPVGSSDHPANGGVIKGEAEFLFAGTERGLGPATAPVALLEGGYAVTQGLQFSD